MLRRALAPGVAGGDFDVALRAADHDGDELSMATGRDVGFDQRVGLVLDRLGVGGAALGDRSAYLMAEQAALALTHPPRPLTHRLPQLLAAVAERMPVVLTSNTGMLPGELMRKLLRLAGFRDDLGMVFSNEVGAAKPSREIFDIAVGVVAVPAPDVLHVGDNPVADVRGAGAAGLRTLLVEPDGVALAARLETIARA
ncbi:HAD-IA family hydrolase [Allobranchiibius sp. CTAmp26]|nr:HAD-IA family hydrolase [Allobranchiibius sp. CTAmp26]MBO1754947.1 HAD-IA family hydrolase [Allobranchiibius sp. CTAmp26]